MTPQFITAFEYTLGHEGGFQKDPDDRGNWTTGIVGQGKLVGTKFGITAMSYPSLDIPNLTVDKARAIYYRDFWKRFRLDELDPLISKEVFDTGVNAGPAKAIKFFQEALNLLNRNQRDYANISVDGGIGNQTMSAYCKVTNISKLHKVMNCLQAEHYIELMRKNEMFEKYSGWFNRVSFSEIA